MSIYCYCACEDFVSTYVSTDLQKTHANSKFQASVEEKDGFLNSHYQMLDSIFLNGIYLLKFL